MNLEGECADLDGCNTLHADDPNHHHHDISHTHPFDDIGHVHDNLLEDGRVMYEEPVERCLHRYLSDYQVCDDCGAEQRWVVQIYPEVKP